MRNYCKTMCEQKYQDLNINQLKPYLQSYQKLPNTCPDNSVRKKSYIYNEIREYIS